MQNASGIVAVLMFVLSVVGYRYIFPYDGIWPPIITGAILSFVGYVVTNKIMNGSFKVNKHRMGFGGALYIFAFIVILKFYASFRNVERNLEFMETSDFIQLTTPGGEIFHPYWGLSIYSAILSSIIIMIIILLTGYYCYKMSRKFKYLSIALMSLSVVFVFWDLLLKLSIQHNYPYELLDPIYSALSRNIFYFAIWVPYFLFSKRVNNTFVN